jgi:hypothetical protein
MHSSSGRGLAQQGKALGSVQILGNNLSDKGHVSRVFIKEFCKLSKKTTPFKKRTKDVNTSLSRYRWCKLWEDVQHCYHLWEMIKAMVSYHYHCPCQVK